MGCKSKSMQLMGGLMSKRNKNKTTIQYYFDRCDFCDTSVIKDQLEWRVSFGDAGFMCPDCVSEEDEAISEGAVWPSAYNNTLPYGYGDGYATDQTDWWNHPIVPTGTAIQPRKICNHHLVPFEIGSGQYVYLSGSQALSKEPEGPEPNMAVYLSDTWLIKGQIFSNDGTVTPEPDEPRTVYVDWPDFNVIDIEALLRVIKIINDGLKAGYNIEIGCHGGHGRTGTLVASLCVMHGETAEDAIARIRLEYCDRAIETKDQEELVKSLETKLYLMPEKEII